MNQKLIAREFQMQTEKAFAPFLTSYGFTLISSEADWSSFRVIFRCDQCYVRISGTVHPLDTPYFFTVSFGNGSDQTWPESDWNAAPLWRILRDRYPAEDAENRDLFSIPDGISAEEIELKMNTCAALCERAAADFLRGDLRVFRQVRAEQTREREPYKIHAPDQSGNYQTFDDEESVSLKARYSVENGAQQTSDGNAEKPPDIERES